MAILRSCFWVGLIAGTLLVSIVVLICRNPWQATLVPQPPYSASPQRRDEIISSFKMLKIGMSADDVIRIMGKPDRQSWIYVPDTGRRHYDITYMIDNYVPNPDGTYLFSFVIVDCDENLRVTFINAHNIPGLPEMTPALPSPTTLP